MAVNEDQTVASLDRVLTRLALTDEEKLEGVLSRLIPAVISQLKTPTEKIRPKVLEILQHVNKRVNAQSDIRLPLNALVDMFVDPQSAPMVKSFALVYVEMAFPRCTAEERGKTVAKLLAGIADRGVQQRDILLRLAVWGLEEFKEPRPEFSTVKGKSAAELLREECPFLASQNDRRVFLDFALKCILYQPPEFIRKTRVATQRVRQSQEANQDPDAMEIDPPVSHAANSDPPIPQGLSQEDVKQVEGKRPPSQQEIAARKLGILNFTASAEVDANDVLLHYIVASCDPQEHVSKRGEELFKKRCRIDSFKPDVDVENAELIARLFSLFLGSDGEGGTTKIEPAGPTLRSKLLTLFVRSMAAANYFPKNIKVVHECIYSADGTVRLRQQGMEFSVWVLKFGDKEKLEAVGKDMLTELLNLLESGETTGRTDTVFTSQRGFAYQALGQMAQRVPSIFQGNPEIAEKMFLLLPTEPAGVRAQVQEAISVMSHAYKGCEGGAKQAIEQLLVDSIKSEESAVRLCGVQWAVKLFPFDHIPARYICILGAGDDKVEVSEEAKRGLKVQKDRWSVSLTGKHTEERKVPDLQEFLDYLRQQQPRFNSAADVGERLILSPKSFLALITFMKECWEAKVKQGDVDLQLISDFSNTVEHAMIRDTTSQLLAEAFECIVQIAQEDMNQIANRYTEKIGLLRDFLGHVDNEARDLCARIMGIAVRALDADAAVDLLQSVVKIAEGDGTGRKFELKSGGLAATGYVLAQCVDRDPPLPETDIQSAAEVLAKVLHDPSPQLAATAALGLGHAGVQKRLRLRDMGEEKSETTLKGVIEQLVELMKAKEHKVVVKIVKAAGFVLNGMFDTDLSEVLLKGLLSLQSNKAEEVQFAVGEALSFAFGGVPIPPSQILTSNFTSLEHCVGLDEQPDSPMTDIDAPLPSNTTLKHPNPHSRMQDIILQKILREGVVHSRPEVRCSGCVWLVCLLAYTDRHALMIQHLEAIQGVLLNLVGDANELTQEMASRGLSLVYSLGDEDVRKKLVAGLTGVLQGAAGGGRVVKLEGDTKVFEEGQMGKAPGGGGISTYKELCALATDLGQPDLIYKFMDLANHQMALNSKRGAAFGFARIAKLAGNELQPHVDKLIPRLYRYQHDPNARVQESMSHIWEALVDNPKKAVDDHFDAIMKELLQEMGNRLWRNREAASRALMDLLQGRKWCDLSSHMESVWIMTFRVIDDIKQSVRQAGWALMRSLKGITLRLTDSSHSSTADAASAVEIVLPLLLDKGMQSSVDEVRAISIDVIAKLAKGAGPGPIKPLLPELMCAMLESLSSLESAKLNYIEQHVEGLGMDAEKFENLRVSAAKSSPMGDTLDLCVRYVDMEGLETLVPKLVELVRRGVGLNTRVGTARFIGQLSTKMGSEFRSHCSTLARALMPKAISEHSSTVRKAYATTLGMLCKNAPPKRVEKIVNEAITTYQEQGDRDARQMCGLILKELNKQAPEAFQVHACTIIPVAFFARFDEDDAVGSVWGSVWEDGTTSESAAVRIYAKELVAGLIEGVQSQQWGKKAAAAKAISSLCEINGEAIQPYSGQLSSQLLKEMPGRIWDGKENVIGALASLCKSCTKDMLHVSLDVVRAVKSATEKGKKAYRESAMEHLVEVLNAFPNVDHFGEVQQLIVDACRRHTEEPTTKSSEASESDPPAQAKLPLKPVLQCLAAAWPGACANSQITHGSVCVESLGNILKGIFRWDVKVTALETGKSFVKGTKKEAIQKLHEWAVEIIPGVLECTTEPKFQQLRTAALQCLEAILEASGNGSALGGDCVGRIKGRLDEMLEQEKLSIVKAHAARILDSLKKTESDMVVDG